MLVDCTRPGWTKGVLTLSKLISCILGYSFFVPFEGWSVCLVSLWFVTVYAGSDTELWPSTFSSHGIGQYHCFQLFGQLCMNLNKGSIRHHLIIVSIGRLCQVTCQNRNVIYLIYLSWSPLNKRKKKKKERDSERERKKGRKEMRMTILNYYLGNYERTLTTTAFFSKFSQTINLIIH